MSQADQAVALFQGQSNCAQSIVATFAEPLGMTRETALRAACAFGGGMRRADTCGAVTGALLVLGLRHASGDPDDETARAEVYRLAGQFQDRFEQRFGTVVCRQLLGCDISTPEGMQHARQQNLFKTRCVDLVRGAAQILEEMAR